MALMSWQAVRSVAISEGQDS
ncbi:hypothetical protein RS9917_04550 [Synechococcus sp. RS9917]|nr:hypothetical protein RS9917_04550 [Synechococcus sp. RS9917]